MNYFLNNQRVQAMQWDTTNKNAIEAFIGRPVYILDLEDGKRLVVPRAGDLNLELMPGEWVVRDASRKLSGYAPDTSFTPINF